nr:RloB domain-containing protein [Adlercreutzia sp. ZJ138]
MSNPKFELFLVMHYEQGKGCTTPQKVDAALKRHWGRYAKRVPATQFTLDQVKMAIENAKKKRTCCQDALPAPGITDAFLLISRLIEGKKD